MNIDLTICGGFVLNVDDDMNDDALHELIERIQDETNAAVGKVAYENKIKFTGIELQPEE